MLVRVAHSPDPDDAFMFYALKHRKFPTPGYEWEDILGDIESLNRAALQAEYEVTAISIHAYPYLAQSYALLNMGGSLGVGYGPVVVARENFSSLKNLKIAVPGKLTSAYLVLKLYEPEFKPVEVKFDRILEEVASGRVDAGLLIHEGQLTYQKMGLKKVVDLGEWWHEETSLPLPLGGNAIRRDLGEHIKEIAGYLKKSIEYALKHEEEALNYAMKFGRGLSREENRRFVRMYVNNYTLDYGVDGRRAVTLLLKRGYEAGIIPDYVDPEFVG